MTQMATDRVETRAKTPSTPHPNGRHQLVSDILGQKLSDQELEQALRICDEEFANDQEFSASAFCARFTASTPSATLGKQTRILFLQNARFPDAPDSNDPVDSAIRESSSQSLLQTAREALNENPSERRESPRKCADLSGTCYRLKGHQTRFYVCFAIALCSMRSLKRIEACC